MVCQGSSSSLNLGSRNSVHMRGGTAIPPWAPSNVIAKSVPTLARLPSKADGTDIAQPVSR